MPVHCGPVLLLVHLEVLHPSVLRNTHRSTGSLSVTMGNGHDHPDYDHWLVRMVNLHENVSLDVETHELLVTMRWLSLNFAPGPAQLRCASLCSILWNGRSQC